MGQDFSDARTLACNSDILFEIADTGDKEFLKFLEAREAFMRGPPIPVVYLLDYSRD